IAGGRLCAETDLDEGLAKPVGGLLQELACIAAARAGEEREHPAGPRVESQEWIRQRVAAFVWRQDVEHELGWRGGEAAKKDDLTASRGPAFRVRAKDALGQAGEPGTVLVALGNGFRQRAIREKISLPASPGAEDTFDRSAGN